MPESVSIDVSAGVFVDVGDNGAGGASTAEALLRGMIADVCEVGCEDNR